MLENEDEEGYSLHLRTVIPPVSPFDRRRWLPVFPAGNARGHHKVSSPLSCCVLRLLAFAGRRVGEPIDPM